MLPNPKPKNIIFCRLRVLCVVAAFSLSQVFLLYLYLVILQITHVLSLGSMEGAMVCF